MLALDAGAPELDAVIEHIGRQRREIVLAVGVVARSGARHCPGLQAVGADHRVARQMLDHQVMAVGIESVGVALGLVRLLEAFAELQVEDPIAQLLDAQQIAETAGEARPIGAGFDRGRRPSGGFGGVAHGIFGGNAIKSLAGVVESLILRHVRLLLPR